MVSYISGNFCDLLVKFPATVIKSGNFAELQRKFSVNYEWEYLWDMHENFLWVSNLNIFQKIGGSYLI